MIQIASVFKPLFKPKRYKVFYGGRGGAKSWAFAQALILKGAESKLLILCTREYQSSIQDSVHRLLSAQIEKMGLSDFYDIQQTCIIGRNGTRFIFEGLKRNATKIKSMEGVDICWCEEAESITENSWDILIPTIRKAGSEIWVSFNPFDELDATYQRYVINPPAESIVIKVGWRDNPWFPDELKAEMEDCKRKNYNKYLHIWEGEPNTDYEDSIIQPKWFDACIDAHIKIGFEGLGVKCLGFDPADSGGDSKAVAMRHGSIIEKIKVWDDGELPEAINKAFSYADDWRVDNIVYDSDGLGRGVKVGLDKRTDGKNIVVTPYGGNDKKDYETDLYMNHKTNKETFKNKRAQYWWYLKDRIEATYNAVEKKIYTDPEKMISFSSEIGEVVLRAAKAELSRVQRKRGENSFIQIESKEDMRKRGVKSPNIGDALVMCFANPAPKAAFEPIQFMSEF